MPISPESLRELHRLHRQLTDLRGRLSRGPKLIAAGEGNCRKTELELEQAKEAVKKTRIAADQKQLQLKSREDKIRDLKTKLNQAASNREFQLLKEQIAADEQANGVLADEILEALEKLDELVGNVKVAESNKVKAREEAARVKGCVDEEREALESEVARVQANLTAVEDSLPADFRVEYDRISKARGEDTLAQVDGEVCGGCYTKLTSQTMNELFMFKPVFCKSCGSLLYLPEDRGPSRSRP